MRNPTSFVVCGIFMMKRKMVRVGRSGKHSWEIVNNGQIDFSYDEAEKVWGIPRLSFGHAIKELLGKGILDITATEMGVHKVKNLYALSERWHDYGTPNFMEATIPKSSIKNPGFKRGNKLWEKKSSIVREHGAVSVREHGEILAVRTDEHGQKIKILYNWKHGKWLESKIA